MADIKKYYYLKLKDDFFDSDELIVLENMPDGCMYSNILLKLYLRSIKNGGKLMFNERIPYNSTILAQITRHSVGVVEKAIQLFAQLGLIEIMDNGAIFMLDIQNYIGESSSEADRKRLYRQKIENERLAAASKGQMSGQIGGHLSALSPDKPTPEIEIELELNKEIEIELKEPPAPYEKIKELFNSTCISYSNIKTLSKNRKTAIKARWKQYEYKLEVFEELFQLAEGSAFLKGDNNRGWKADFDWFIKEDNMAKVLEGKYDNKEVNEGGSRDGSVIKYGW